MKHDGHPQGLNILIERIRCLVVGIEMLIGREPLEAFHAEFFYCMSPLLLVRGSVFEIYASEKDDIFMPFAEVRHEFVGHLCRRLGGIFRQDNGPVDVVGFQKIDGPVRRDTLVKFSA